MGRLAGARELLGGRANPTRRRRCTPGAKQSLSTNGAGTTDLHTRLNTLQRDALEMDRWRKCEMQNHTTPRGQPGRKQRWPWAWLLRPSCRGTNRAASNRDAGRGRRGQAGWGGSVCGRHTRQGLCADRGLTAPQEESNLTDTPRRRCMQMSSDSTQARGKNKPLS